jgi:hypothetical protein
MNSDEKISEADLMTTIDTLQLMNDRLCKLDDNSKENAMLAATFNVAALSCLKLVNHLMSGDTEAVAIRKTFRG